MKLSKTVIAVTTLSAMVAFAGVQTAAAQEEPEAQQQQGNYGMAGCGLGAMIFGEGGGILQVFAATSNAFLGTQTFGITSGTSECVERGVVQEQAEQQAFFEMNYDNLKAEMATGQGEHLEAMTSLMGCSEEVHPQVADTAQSNYEEIFADEQTAPAQALNNYKAQLNQRDDIAQSCDKL